MTLVILYYMPASYWTCGEQSEGSGNRGVHGSKIVIWRKQETKYMHRCFELLMIINYMMIEMHSVVRSAQIGTC